MSLVGTVYILLFGRFLLPAHQGDDEAIDHFRLDGYYIELVILPDSTLVGKNISQIEELQKTDFKYLAWYRRQIIPAANLSVVKKSRLKTFCWYARTRINWLPSSRNPALPCALCINMKRNSIKLQEGDNNKDELFSSMVQSIVAPRSELIGKTIGQVDFLRTMALLLLEYGGRRAGYAQNYPA